MERVTLGSSGLSVSPIAFGTWQLSPRFWGEQSRDDALAAMKCACDLGINFFDTADAYGDGYAETVLGEALRDLPRRELVVCTKWFNHFNPDASRYPDLSAQHLRERCDASLQRLGIETIDLCLLHMFDPLTPLEEVAETLTDLRHQGKVRAFGVSNHTVEQVRAQRRYAPYSVVQPAYSLIDPAIETDLLPYCQAENVGVMVYSPLHKGLPEHVARIYLPDPLEENSDGTWISWDISSVLEFWKVHPNYGLLLTHTGYENEGYDAVYFASVNYYEGSMDNAGNWAPYLQIIYK